MSTRTILAAVVGSIAAFLLGYVIWGVLLMDYFDSSTIHYEGLMLPETEMKLWAIYIANLASAFLFAWLFTRMGISTPIGGAQAGAIINALFALSMDMMFYSMMNWYKSASVIAVDILVNTVYGAIIGAI